MNKEKISKFIYELRKEKKLTQQELADKLYVSSNAVSKWERGVCLPDVTTFDKVAEALNVSVAELIAGEKLPDDNRKIYDTILMSNLKENNKKIKKRNIIIITLLSLIVIAIISVLGIFFFNNYNNITTYSFTGSSENFEFNNGTIVFSKKKGMISISNFKVIDNSDIEIESIEQLKISVLFNEKEWASDSYNSQEDKSINEWLSKNVYFYEGPSSQCLKSNSNCGRGVFDKIDKSEFPQNLKIKISYCLKESCYTEEFEVVAVQIASNQIIN